MIKFFLIALISAQALGQPRDIIFPTPIEEPEVVRAISGEPGVELFTFPFPGKSPLGLTTGDLKIFSGHALNLLKSKCPKVDQKLILGLQKYIGRQIAKVADPVPGDNQKFRDVLKTVKDCSAEVTPRGSGGGLLSISPRHRNPENTESADLWENSSEEEEAKGDEGKLITIIPSDSPLASPNWKSKWSHMSSAEKKAELTNIYNTNTKPASSSSTTRKTTVGTTTTTTVPSISTTTPKLPVMSEAPKEEKKGPFSSLISWVSNMFHTVTNFFKSMFGFGTRTRRSAPGPDAGDSDEVGPIVITRISAPVPGRVRISPDLIPTLNGQQAFVQLISGICKVYCDRCPMVNAKEFKVAGKELLDYIFAHVSPSGIELAAANYLTPEFLNEISACIASF